MGVVAVIPSPLYYGRKNASNTLLYSPAEEWVSRVPLFFYPSIHFSKEGKRAKGNDETNIVRVVSDVCYLIGQPFQVKPGKFQLYCSFTVLVNGTEAPAKRWSDLDTHTEIPHKLTRRSAVFHVNVCSRCQVHFLVDTVVPLPWVIPK